ncbi:MAG: hypothetical protein RR490_01515 [Niameybacter sp.]
MNSWMDGLKPFIVLINFIETLIAKKAYKMGSVKKVYNLESLFKK